MKKIFKLIFLCTVILLFSCKKSWLDVKPRDSQVVPTTIADAQALLDDNGNINILYAGEELSSDDYQLEYTTWLGIPVAGYRNYYIWASDIWEGVVASDWSGYYKQVFNANVALDALRKVRPNATNNLSYNTAKGHSLFIRGLAHYNLSNSFGQPYASQTADAALGIPLRLGSDVNDIATRSSVAKTYQQIISDLKESVALLPNTPVFTTRPSKTAAYALLARVYLQMGDYGNAELYADSCLQIKNSLIDFNALSLTSTAPIVRDNIETIYYLDLQNAHNLRPGNLIVPSNIYQFYQTSDLRKDIYFYTLNGKLTRKASYTGTTGAFGGLAVDEQYLIRAEARARLGRTAGAMGDLNTLLVKRFKTGTFIPLVAANADAALSIILNERRKELIYRGLRWSDLRRLNLDPRFAVTLTRTLNGITYILPPNDKRFTFPIPEIEIRAYGMPQNER